MKVGVAGVVGVVSGVGGGGGGGFIGVWRVAGGQLGGHATWQAQPRWRCAASHVVDVLLYCVCPQSPPIRLPAGPTGQLCCKCNFKRDQSVAAGGDNADTWWLEGTPVATVPANSNGVYFFGEGAGGEGWRSEEGRRMIQGIEGQKGRAAN